MRGDKLITYLIHTTGTQTALKRQVPDDLTGPDGVPKHHRVGLHAPLTPGRLRSSRTGPASPGNRAAKCPIANTERLSR